MSDRSKHLGLAILFTVLTLIGINHVFRPDWANLGTVSQPSPPNPRGDRISITEPFSSLIFSSLASIYCWWAYWTDPSRKRRK
jgi:hypothetical protein